MHLSRGANETIVLYDVVPSYFLRQESSGSICMEHYGTCREACSKRGFFFGMIILHSPNSFRPFQLGLRTLDIRYIPEFSSTWIFIHFHRP